MPDQDWIHLWWLAVAALFVGASSGWRCTGKLGADIGRVFAARHMRCTGCDSRQRRGVIYGHAILADGSLYCPETPDPPQEDLPRAQPPRVPVG